MKVFITGGTGFIGSAIATALVARGDRPIVLTRGAGRAAELLGEGVDVIEGDPTAEGDWQDAVRGCGAAVNLAGEALDARRWNAHVRQRILDSRVETTRYLVEAIAKAAAPERPEVLVSASGADYYPFALDLDAAGGDEEDEVDESTPPGEGFLARVCSEWEKEARAAEKSGVRVVRTRFGIVLGRDGALSKMALPFRLFAGGRIGSGRQWMSWIHADDLVRAVLFVIDHPEISGPVNAVAPEAVRNRDFAGALGRALGRPSWLPVPGFALRAAIGGLAEYMLEGRRVVPRRLVDAGFEFRFGTVEAALGDLL